ncbi:MAG: ABC transporter ATP-binding protein [Rhodospirillales bacterium]|nr:ABC transporter ATP-binding protein [Rhodospirillales bacterium]
MALVEVRNLRVETNPRNKRIPVAVLVDDISFDLEKGKVLGLIGESGAGKSTIGLTALGYARNGCHITGGEITINGRDIRKISIGQLRAFRGEEVTYVAQSAAAGFNPAHKLNKQIIETTVHHGTSSARDALKYAAELFKQLGLPDPESFGDRFPHQVSGGQLQRAMTAMALCSRPDLIVFDEPTTALDVTTQIDVLAAIKRTIEFAGTAALYITHDLAVVAQVTDEIMVLRRGKMVEYGTVDQILNAPTADYTQRLVSVNRIAAHEKTETNTPIIEMRNVTASYSGTSTKVLDDVSMMVCHGQTLAVVGESGSGKSTAARVMTGLLPPSKGQVFCNGNVLPPSIEQRSREQLRDMQMISQMPDVALNPRQNVGNIIGRPVTLYFGIKGKKRRQRVIELLKAVELDESYMDRLPGILSGGEKQRVCIARALAAKPSVIICDEVTSALDPLVADEILKLLDKLQAETNMAYVFITHDIATVRAIADTIAVMYLGKVVESGQKTKILTPPHHDYTHLLLSSVPEMEIGWLEKVIEERRMEAAGN